MTPYQQPQTTFTHFMIMQLLCEKQFFIPDRSTTTTVFVTYVTMKKFISYIDSIHFDTEKNHKNSAELPQTKKVECRFFCLIRLQGTMSNCQPEGLPSKNIQVL
jgi:hypothetical protein